MLYTPMQLVVLRYALDSLIDLLKSPTSADRDADAADADRKIEVATQLLDNMFQVQATLRAVCSNLQAIGAYDCKLNDEANGGENAKSPDGDDYNAIFDLAKAALDDISTIAGAADDVSSALTEQTVDLSAQSTPVWSEEHAFAAAKEGWCIAEVKGSDCARWQIQRNDDASEVPGAQQLESDDDAWRLVLKADLPHHVAAIEFIHAHSPSEYEKIMEFAEDEEIIVGHVPGFSRPPVAPVPEAAKILLVPEANQGALADQAFAAYDFGAGVEVTDTSGWEYTSPGNSRSRKVFVETPREDDGPTPRWTLTFTVRFDATGRLAEACATDANGAIWGSMPKA